MDTRQDFSLIKQVVDKYFDFIDEIGGLQFMTEFIPEPMLDKSKEHEDDDYAYWIPIQSTVSEKEITDLEKLFGHPLPASYIYFLHQRHFVELQLGSHAISFFSSLPGELVSKFKETIEMYYWDLLERNYLPFANFSDFGVLCFDANVKREGNNYPIIMLDHEDGYDERHVQAKNFQELFNEFDTHLDDWIKRNRERR